MTDLALTRDAFHKASGDGELTRKEFEAALIQIAGGGAYLDKTQFFNLAQVLSVDIKVADDVWSANQSANESGVISIDLIISFIESATNKSVGNAVWKNFDEFISFTSAGKEYLNAKNNLKDKAANVAALVSSIKASSSQNGNEIVVGLLNKYDELIKSANIALEGFDTNLINNATARINEYIGKLNQASINVKIESDFHAAFDKILNQYGNKNGEISKSDLIKILKEITVEPNKADISANTISDILGKLNIDNRQVAFILSVFDPKKTGKINLFMLADNISQKLSNKITYEGLKSFFNSSFQIKSDAELSFYNFASNYENNDGAITAQEFLSILNNLSVNSKSISDEVISNILYGLGAKKETIISFIADLARADDGGILISSIVDLFSRNISGATYWTYNDINSFLSNIKIKSQGEIAFLDVASKVGNRNNKIDIGEISILLSSLAINGDSQKTNAKTFFDALKNIGVEEKYINSIISNLDIYDSGELSIPTLFNLIKQNFGSKIELNYIEFIDMLQSGSVKTPAELFFDKISHKLGNRDGKFDKNELYDAFSSIGIEPNKIDISTEKLSEVLQSLGIEKDIINKHINSFDPDKNNKINIKFLVEKWSSGLSDKGQSWGLDDLKNFVINNKEIYSSSEIFFYDFAYVFGNKDGKLDEGELIEVLKTLSDDKDKVFISIANIEYILDGFGYSDSQIKYFLSSVKNGPDNIAITDVVRIIFSQFNSGLAETKISYNDIKKYVENAHKIKSDSELYFDVITDGKGYINKEVIERLISTNVKAGDDGNQRLKSYISDLYKHLGISEAVINGALLKIDSAKDFETNKSILINNAQEYLTGLTSKQNWSYSEFVEFVNSTPPILSAGQKNFEQSVSLVGVKDNKLSANDLKTLLKLNAFDSKGIYISNESLKKIFVYIGITSIEADGLISNIDIKKDGLINIDSFIGQISAKFKNNNWSYDDFKKVLITASHIKTNGENKFDIFSLNYGNKNGLVGADELYLAFKGMATDEAKTVINRDSFKLYLKDFGLSDSQILNAISLIDPNQTGEIKISLIVNYTISKLQDKTKSNEWSFDQFKDLYFAISKQKTSAENFFNDILSQLGETDKVLSYENFIKALKPLVVKDGIYINVETFRNIFSRFDVQPWNIDVLQGKLDPDNTGFINIFFIADSLKSGIGKSSWTFNEFKNYIDKSSVNSKTPEIFFNTVANAINNKDGKINAQELTDALRLLAFDEKKEFVSKDTLSNIMKEFGYSVSDIDIVFSNIDTLKTGLIIINDFVQRAIDVLGNSDWDFVKFKSFLSSLVKVKSKSELFFDELTNNSGNKDGKLTLAELGNAIQNYGEVYNKEIITIDNMKFILKKLNFSDSKINVIINKIANKETGLINIPEFINGLGDGVSNLKWNFEKFNKALDKLSSEFTPQEAYFRNFSKLDNYKTSQINTHILFNGLKELSKDNNKEFITTEALGDFVKNLGLNEDKKNIILKIADPQNTGKVLISTIVSFFENSFGKQKNWSFDEFVNLLNTSAVIKSEGEIAFDAYAKNNGNKDGLIDAKELIEVIKSMANAEDKDFIKTEDLAKLFALSGMSQPLIIAAIANINPDNTGKVLIKTIIEAITSQLKDYKFDFKTLKKYFEWFANQKSQGKINFDNLAYSVGNNDSILNEEELRSLLTSNASDSAKSFVKSDTFSKFISSLGYSDEEVRNAINILDSDGDGQINIDAFVKYVISELGQGNWEYGSFIKLFDQIVVPKSEGQLFYETVALSFGNTSGKLNKENLIIAMKREAILGQDDYISYEKFKNILSRLGVPSAQIVGAIDEFDSEKTGKIKISDFASSVDSFMQSNNFGTDWKFSDFNKFLYGLKAILPDDDTVFSHTLNPSVELNASILEASLVRGDRNTNNDGLISKPEFSVIMNSFGFLPYEIERLSSAIFGQQDAETPSAIVNYLTKNRTLEFNNVGDFISKVRADSVKFDKDDLKSILNIIQVDGWISKDSFIEAAKAAGITQLDLNIIARRLFTNEKALSVDDCWNALTENGKSKWNTFADFIQENAKYTVGDTKFYLNGEANTPAIEYISPRNNLPIRQEVKWDLYILPVSSYRDRTKDEYELIYNFQVASGVSKEEAQINAQKLVTQPALLERYFYVSQKDKILKNQVTFQQLDTDFKNTMANTDLAAELYRNSRLYNNDWQINDSWEEKKKTFKDTIANLRARGMDEADSALFASRLMGDYSVELKQILAPNSEYSSDLEKGKPIESLVYGIHENVVTFSKWLDIIDEQMKKAEARKDSVSYLLLNFTKTIIEAGKAQATIYDQDIAGLTALKAYATGAGVTFKTVFEMIGSGDIGAFGALFSDVMDIYINIFRNDRTVKSGGNNDEDIRNQFIASFNTLGDMATAIGGVAGGAKEGAAAGKIMKAIAAYANDREVSIHQTGSTLRLVSGVIGAFGDVLGESNLVNAANIIGNLAEVDVQWSNLSGLLKNEYTSDMFRGGFQAVQLTANVAASIFHGDVSKTLQQISNLAGVGMEVSKVIRFKDTIEGLSGLQFNAAVTANMLKGLLIVFDIAGIDVPPKLTDLVNSALSGLSGGLDMAKVKASFQSLSKYIADGINWISNFIGTGSNIVSAAGVAKNLVPIGQTLAVLGALVSVVKFGQSISQIADREDITDFKKINLSLQELANLLAQFGLILIENPIGWILLGVAAVIDTGAGWANGIEYGFNARSSMQVIFPVIGPLIIDLIDIEKDPSIKLSTYIPQGEWTTNQIIPNYNGNNMDYVETVEVGEGSPWWLGPFGGLFTDPDETHVHLDRYWQSDFGVVRFYINDFPEGTKPSYIKDLANRFKPYIDACLETDDILAGAIEEADKANGELSHANEIRGNRGPTMQYYLNTSGDIGEGQSDIEIRRDFKNFSFTNMIDERYEKIIEKFNNSGTVTGANLKLWFDGLKIKTISKSAVSIDLMTFIGANPMLLQLPQDVITRVINAVPPSSTKIAFELISEILMRYYSLKNNLYLEVMGQSLSDNEMLDVVFEKLGLHEDNHGVVPYATIGWKDVATDPEEALRRSMQELVPHYSLNHAGLRAPDVVKRANLIKEIETAYLNAEYENYQHAKKVGFQGNPEVEFIGDYANNSRLTAIRVNGKLEAYDFVKVGDDLSYNDNYWVQVSGLELKPENPDTWHKKYPHGRQQAVEPYISSINTKWIVTPLFPADPAVKEVYEQMRAQGMDVYWVGQNKDFPNQYELIVDGVQNRYRFDGKAFIKDSNTRLQVNKSNDTTSYGNLVNKVKIENPNLRGSGYWRNANYDPYNAH